MEREHTTNRDKKRLRDIPFIKGIPNNGFNGDNKDSVRHFSFPKTAAWASEFAAPSAHRPGPAGVE